MPTDWRKRFGRPSGLDDGDVRQVAILLGEVEAVADDEPIGNLEADVLDLHVDLPPRRLTQQAGRPQRLWTARAEDILQIRERETGVDDVLDDDDALAVEGRIEIFEETHLAGAGRALGVARERH